MGVLPEVSDRAPVAYDYFPTVWQAVLFRNWGLMPVERLAAVLGTDESTLREEAEKLGLDGKADADENWITRGYLTIIRENWHLLPFEDICTLLNITDEHLAFLLKEDDFMWHKMGQVKPFCRPARYKPTTQEQETRTAVIREIVREAFPDGVKDNAFDFLNYYMRELTEEERAEAINSVQDTDNLRTVYSYFALYGDPLADPSLDPFPEALLADYAKMGVKGVWLQGLLYQLVEFPFAPEKSVGCEKRMAALNALIERAARYGVGVYMYLNEPRAMEDAFFQKYPHLRGKREGDFYAMCTSCPEVKEYLEDAMFRLFSRAKGLAGFFTITKSENLTNCYSRVGDGVPCPRCRERKETEVIAEVNNLMARGARRANPKARAIAWNWAWNDEWAHEIPKLLTEGQIVQCTSEERMPTDIGGVQGEVVDYAMSLCGPGEKAKRVWKAALNAGLETCAKVQFNNTWEMSAAPWLPVMDKIATHVRNMTAVGVKHLQLSWTLGGAPSPNLRLAAYLMDGGESVEKFLCGWLGEKLGKAANEGQKRLSNAFSEFPFHVGTLYVGPQNYGPMTPFFLEKTGWRATMIGFPYDSVDDWRSIYPREVFLKQLKRLTDGWREGVETLAAHEGECAEYDDMCLMARAALSHFESAYHQTAFVLAREANDRKIMLETVRAERENVFRAIKLRRRDSRIGYEASNHYYYSMNDLAEKLINLEFVEEALKRTTKFGA